MLPNKVGSLLPSSMQHVAQGIRLLRVPVVIHESQISIVLLMGAGGTQPILQHGSECSTICHGPRQGVHPLGKTLGTG